MKSTDTLMAVKNHHIEICLDGPGSVFKDLNKGRAGSVDKESFLCTLPKRRNDF